MNVGEKSTLRYADMRYCGMFREMVGSSILKHNVILRKEFILDEKGPGSKMKNFYL